MTRPHKALYVIVSLTLVALSCRPGLAVGAKANTIAVPCPAYSVGDRWVYSRGGPSLNSRIEEIVVQNKGGRIVLDSKEINKIRTPTGEVTQTAATELVIEYRGGTANITKYVSNTGGAKAETITNYPICGDIPVDGSADRRTNFMGNEIVEEQRLLMRSLGKERITVPAGIFETDVIEITAKVDSANAHSSVTKLFIAKKVGLVRSVLETEMMMPTGNVERNMDPKISELLQQGIKDMQAGKDASEIMKQVQEMSGGSDSAGGYRKTKSTMIKELISYKIK